MKHKLKHRRKPRSYDLRLTFLVSLLDSSLLQESTCHIVIIIEIPWLMSGLDFGLNSQNKNSIVDSGTYD